ncbi:MAG: type II toxin-antitoxin system HicB family antitoxin [Erysipelotrichaceae bacterium]|nr:type II toxin-antitoxin system HicB family antitoxin [Erysipelotrichaceae bacterium]
MLSIYPAVFFKEENGYSVIFPDLNDLATDGDTLSEAMMMAIDCLAGYLFTAKIDNIPVSNPSDIKNISPEVIAKELGFSYEDAFVNLISVDVEEYAKLHFNKSVKKTLTIPEWLNKEALSKGINFSQVLQEALISKLQSM